MKFIYILSILSLFINVIKTQSASCSFSLDSNNTVECGFCLSIPPSMINIKKFVNMTALPLKISNLIPFGLESFSETIILENYLGFNPEPYGISNTFSFQIDTKEALSFLPSVPTNVTRAITEDVLDKLLYSKIFGDLCVDISFDLCKEEVDVFAYMAEMKLFQLDLLIFPPLDLCPTYENTQLISYSPQNRELSVCYPFFQLLYGNSVCVRLKDLIWGGEGIAACPSVAFLEPFIDGSILDIDLPCFSFGSPDPCNIYPNCSDCASNIGCNWCSARNMCISLLNELNTCSGCLAGFAESCNSKELSIENIVCADFYKFDPDSDWVITRQEYHAEIGYWFSFSEENSTFNQYDINSDGNITYNEYKQIQILRTFPHSSNISSKIFGIAISVVLLLSAVISVPTILLKKFKPETYTKIKNFFAGIQVLKKLNTA